MKQITFLVETLLKQVLFVLMLLLTVAVIWQVISRYALRYPATWTDEVARFSMIWVALLGGVYVYAQGRHLAVTILPEKWEGTARGHALNVFFHFLVVVLGVCVTAGGYSVASTNFINGQLSSVLHINMGYVYASVPVTGVLLIMYALTFICREIRAMTHTPHQTGA